MAARWAAGARGRARRRGLREASPRAPERSKPEPGSEGDKMEDYHSSSSLPDLTMTGLDDTDPDTEGVLGSFPSCIDQSIISIIEDSSQTENKQLLDEESEATLLTALTEILDTVDDENPSPFDSIPDSEIFALPKGGCGCSLVGRQSCAVLPDSGKELFAHWVPAASKGPSTLWRLEKPKNRSFGEGISQQRSDGEEEDEDMINNGQGVSESGSELLDLHSGEQLNTPGLESGVTLLIGQNLPCGFNMKHVSLSDLVKYVHPYCLPMEAGTDSAGSVIELDVQVVQEGEMLDLEIPTVLCQGSECLPGGTVETGTELAAGEDPGPESQLQTLEQQEVLPAPPVQQESPPVLVRRRGRPRKTVKPTKTLVIGVQQDSTETPHSQSGLQTLLQTTENKKETPNKAQPLLAHRKQEGLAVTLQESRLLAQQMEEVKLGARRIQTRGRTAAGRESRQRATVSKVARGQRKPSPSETWSAKRGWSFPWVQDGAVEPPETAVKQLTHPEQRLERISTQALCIDPDPDPVPPPRADPEPAPQADPNPAQAPRTDPTPADPTPAPRMGSDPALAPQLPACDVPSPVVPANGSNEPRLRPISLQQYRLRLQQRQQQSTLSAHANPRFGSDSGRKSAWPIVPIQSIVQGELSVLPLETAGHMVRGQAMGREGQPSAPPARNLTPPARTLIPPTLPPATLAAPVRALLPPSLAQPVRALAPPTLTPPVRALLPPTLAQPVRALAPPTMSPPVRALAPPTLAPPVGALAPPVRALAPPVRALTPPTLAPPDRALTPPTMAPPVRALTPPTLAPPVRALTPPTLAPPVRALAPPVRALTPPTLAPPVRALTPPTLAPPVRALTPPTLAPPVRALTPPTLAPPVRALTPPTLAPPVRALTPPTLAPPVRALTPPTLAPPGRALTPPTLAPPGRALTPPTLAPPGRALTPPTLAPPGRALTPPTLAPPGRALTPPTLAPPGRALTPPTLAPPGRALTPPTLAPPGRALTPPTLAPPGRALTPPTLAPPGRALAPPTLAPPGRALAPPGRALTPPTLAPPGRALTPPTLAPPGRALAPPGRALTPPTLAPPGRALTPPTLAPPVCALALPVQSLALPTLAPPAQTLALALPTRALIPLSLAPPGCGIMREQPPEFQYKSKQEVVKPATLQGGLNPPAQTRILALQPRLVQDTPALTLCMGTVLTPTTLAQLPAECPSSMPTVSVQAVAVRMCSTTRGEDILSQQNNLLQAEAVKVSTVQTVPVKSPPVQQLQSTEVALAKQEVDQGTLNSAKEASAAKDNPKGIEAADVMSLLEQFEVTEATEEPPPGNSTGSEVSEERKLLDHIFGAELASTAGLTPPATPPHQIWKSVPPVGFLGKRKSQGVESFPGSPLRTVKLIEPKPLPQNNRTKCVAIVSPQPPPETTLTALLDFGDHVYCLPRVSTQPLSHNICPPVVAQPDVGCRWNVRRQASITIKPITLLNHQCLSLTHRVLTAEEQRVSEPGRNGSTSDFQETPQEARASFNSLPTGIASVDPGRSCSQAAGTRNVGCDAALGLKGGRCATMSPCKNGETKQGKPFDSPHRCSRTLTSPCYRHHRYSSCSSSSSTSRSRSHSPAQKRRRYCRRRSRHSRHSSRSDSRSSSRSRSYSRSNSRSDSGSRSRSRSRSRSSRRCSIRMSYFTDAYDPYIEEPRNRYLRHEARARNSRRRELAIDERRVVYVGKIRTGMMREELRRRFEVFGEIEDCNIYFRNEGDNYGFVTYRYTCDAFAAIENGQTLRKPDELPFDLCFGGRRQFCKTNYADLDSSHTDFGSCSTKSKFDSLDFDTLLKQAKRSLRR